MLQAVFIDQKGDIISDDSVGIFIPLDDDKYATLTDCGGVSLYNNSISSLYHKLSPPSIY